MRSLSCNTFLYVFTIILIVCATVLFILSFCCQLSPTYNAIAILILEMLAFFCFLGGLFCGRLDDNAEKSFCSAAVFNELNSMYEDNSSFESKIGKIHSIYSTLFVILDGKKQDGQTHRNRIGIKDLLGRSLELKSRIGCKRNVTENAVVLLPMFYCVVSIIPDLLKQYLGCSYYETLVVAASILIGCAILVLISISLSQRKEDMKTELMNYELNLVEKKISEFQDKSIQQIKKENPNEKQ